MFADSSKITFPFTWKTDPFREMQKGAGRKGMQIKVEGVAGEPCPQGSYQSSDGEMGAIPACAQARPVHPLPVCMHACVGVHICILDIQQRIYNCISAPAQEGGKITRGGASAS